MKGNNSKFLTGDFGSFALLIIRDEMFLCAEAAVRGTARCNRPFANLLTPVRFPVTAVFVVDHHTLRR
jgi:hypothetical protein